jgi:hypothetical protein
VIKNEEKISSFERGARLPAHGNWIAKLECFYNKKQRLTEEK